ncbi:MAG: hypothetical protein M1546_14280 [Chloroflexi bacterium]|nr:hypothetical protein [Chloroflexota bacterium]
MSGVLARRGVFSQVVRVQHDTLGEYELYCEEVGELLFTNNETNFERLYGVAKGTPYVKHAFHDYVVRGNRCAVNSDQAGTKAAALYKRSIAAGATTVIRLRLASVSTPSQPNHLSWPDRPPHGKSPVKANGAGWRWCVAIAWSAC